MKHIYILKSIDCAIGLEGNIKGYIYPLNPDRTPDFMVTQHISDCDQSWWSGLSKNDTAKVKEIHESC